MKIGEHLLDVNYKFGNLATVVLNFAKRFQTSCCQSPRLDSFCLCRSLTNIDAFEATGDEVAEDGTLVKKIPEKSFWAKYVSHHNFLDWTL